MTTKPPDVVIPGVTTSGGKDEEMPPRKPRKDPRKPDSADRHLANPVTFRPPHDDRRWLTDYARRTSQSLGAVLTSALQAYRKQTEQEEEQPE